MTTTSSDRILMLGNEAIARGILEGGASYATGYPGNPSSEILETLFKIGTRHGMAIEWSINEIVALEAAAAFAFSGKRAAVTMKQNGLNVAADFLTTFSLDELAGGLLLVVCDDPGPLTSSNEQDSRHFAKIAHIPLLEPASPHEAKEMAVFGLHISQKFKIPCMLRTVSRLSHGRGPVTIESLLNDGQPAHFDTSHPKVGLPPLVTKNHARLVQQREVIRNRFETAGWNRYTGPENASTVVVASGLSAVYGREAIEMLGLTDKVGLLKIGTPWPIPSKLTLSWLKAADTVLFLEEVDPFLEETVKVVCAEHADRLRRIRFLGKNNGFVAGSNGPGVGEMNTDVAISALSRLVGREPKRPAAPSKALLAKATDLLVPRELSFCPGCSHRASFLALKTALEMDGRDGFLVGDIGCYGMAAGTTGFQLIKALHCMGSGMGNASGFSRLKAFGFDQPVVAVAGDSTFFHAGLPALANAVHQKADAIFVILDNAVTAMTGFQTNPATPASVAYDKQMLRIEDVADGLGVQTEIIDPIADVRGATTAVLDALETGGVRLLIFRRECATFFRKAFHQNVRPVITVDTEKCLGDTCGCNRFCSRVLSCPAILFDANTGVAQIDDHVCTGCGLCVQVCPQKAILLEKVEE